MKIKLLIVILLFLNGCSEKISIYFQDKNSTKYEIIYQNKKGKNLNKNDKIQYFYGFLNIKSNGINIYAGNIYISSGFSINTDNILDNNIILFCSDKYLFEDANYFNKFNLDCELMKEANESTLSTLVHNLNKNTLLKFTITNH